MSMHFLNPEDLPDGIREMIVAQADRHAMANQARHHEVFSMFDELTSDQLKTLSGLFNLMSQDGGDAIAHWLQGVVTTYLRLKHDCCPGCGSSHTPNFDEAAKIEDTPRTEENSESLSADLPAADHDRLADKYNLHFAPHPISGVIGYACRGCGQQYVSLEDRMLKAPDDCAGCHQKAKWG